MTNLTTDAVVSYNGYTFSVMMKTLGVDARSVPDSAGRTTTHKAVTIRLQDIIQSDTGTGATLDNIRSKLEQPGGALAFTNVGFGALVLPSGTLTDLKWGPIPKVLSWESYGSGNAAKVVWQVEFCILEGKANQTGPMEYNYDVSWHIDESGYQRRVVSGHLTIPQTRRNINDRSLKANADSFRDKVYPPLVPAFRRIPGDYKLSEDKCTLTWSVTDVQEGPNFPPPGCIKAKVSHRVESDGNNLRSYTGHFEAEYELRMDLPPSIGTQYFVSLVASRLGPLARKSIGAVGVGRACQTILPVKLTMGQPDLYGKNVVTFGFSYTYTTDIRGILTASGLWTPVPNSNWRLWSASIAPITGERGQAGMKFVNKDDLIIDLGSNDKLPLAGPKLEGSAPPNIKQDVLNHILKAMQFRADDITPSNSWIEYKNIGITTPIDDIAEMKALATKKIDQATGIKGSGTAAAAAMQAIINASAPLKLAEWGYKALSSVKTTVQVRSKPSIYVTLKGSALRAQYPIKPPRLVLAGGTPPIQACQTENSFKTSTVANWGVPIYAAHWNLRYLVPGSEADSVATSSNADFDGVS